MANKIYHDKVRVALRDIINQSITQLREESSANTRIDRKSINLGVEKVFENIANNLVIGNIVTIRGLGTFEPVASRQDNFGAKKRNRSKKKHNYVSIKFSPARKLKSRATEYKDKMTK